MNLCHGVQVNVLKAFQNCRLASKCSTRLFLEEFGVPDLNCRLTQDNLDLDSIKLGESMTGLANR